MDHEAIITVHRIIHLRPIDCDAGERAPPLTPATQAGTHLPTLEGWRLSWPGWLVASETVYLSKDSHPSRY